MLIKSAWQIFILVALLTIGCLCGTIDQRDDSVYQRPWNEDGPFEGDVIQNEVGDCAFLSVMVGIIRNDKNVLLNAVGSLQGKNWPISLYMLDGTLHTFQIEVKKAAEHQKMGYSKTVWVAYFERAFSAWYDLQNIPDTRGARSASANAFKAFYDPDTLNKYVNGTEYCDQDVLLAGGNLARTMPTAFGSKTYLQGSIPQNHIYAMHDANDTHIILRNPWGSVMNAGEQLPPGVTQMDDLGTFSMTMQEAQRACQGLQWFIIPKGETNRTSRVVEGAVASANAQANAASVHTTALDPFTFRIKR